MDCCSGISNKNHCCHCYSNTYLDNDTFLCFPATNCTCLSCEEWVDNEDSEHSSHSCCSSSGEPCCHDCAVFFCPCAVLLDAILLPFRYLMATKTVVEKTPPSTGGTDDDDIVKSDV